MKGTVFNLLTATADTTRGSGRSTNTDDTVSNAEGGVPRRTARNLLRRLLNR